MKKLCFQYWTSDSLSCTEIIEDWEKEEYADWCYNFKH
jgi:hypothetical protein